LGKHSLTLQAKLHRRRGDRAKSVAVFFPTLARRSVILRKSTRLDRRQPPVQTKKHHPAQAFPADVNPCYNRSIVVQIDDAAVPVGYHLSYPESTAPEGTMLMQKLVE
jgi:hypothetical protein